MRIYIATRLTDSRPDYLLSNGGVAIKAGIEVIKRGHIPFIPPLDYLIYMFASNEDLEKFGDKFYYKYSTEWLKQCEAMLIVNGLEDSKGVQKELETAKELGLKIFKSIDEIEKVSL